MIYLGALFSGLCLALLFPKFNFFYLGWVALVPLFWALYASRNGKEALACGLLSGTAFFGLNLWWLTSLKAFVGGWAFLGWLAVVLLQAFWFSIFARVFWQWRSLKLGYKLIFYPACFVVVEWLRSAGPFGVTAGGLGYSQAANLALLQIAAYTSVYGLTFLMVMVNVFLAEWFLTRGFNFKAGMILALFLSLVFAFGLFNLQQDFGGGEGALSLALIQGNIPQEEKLGSLRVFDHFSRYFALSVEALKFKPDLILWPETAVATYLLEQPVWKGAMLNFARANGQELILGLPTYSAGKAYNSLAVLGPLGVGSLYHKERLVPFGEYLPLRLLSYPLLSKTGFFSLDYHPGGENVLLEAAGSKIGAAICFESTFPSLMRRRAAKGANLLLVGTNDAWFFNSAAPYQHLQSGVLRAVENRRYLVQVANTGISAVVDPMGRVVAQSKVGEKVILSGKVVPLEKKSFYTVYGDIFLYCCVVVVLSAYAFWFRKRSPRI